MGRKTLSDELKKYGYVFSLRKSLPVIAATAAAMLVLGRFFGLNRICSLILLIFVLWMLPFFLRNAFRSRYLQRRFSDLNIYMEQFLYSFRKSGKILTTLREVSLLFEEGEMRETIEESCSHILHTYNECDVEKKALAIIECEYPDEVLVMIHQFALYAEKNGGDCDRSISLLLEYRRMKADRAYELLQMRRKKRRDIFLSVLTSLLLCLAAYVISSHLHMDLSEYPVSSVVTTAVLILDLLIFYRADAAFSIEEPKEAQEEELVGVYRRFMKNPGKSPFEKWSRRAAKKRLTRGFEEAFPEWLMQLSLLLQRENVAVAIVESYKEAPKLMKPALSHMIAQMQTDPDGIQPYLDFLSDFTLPEIRSAMKMLYSLSVGSGGEAAGQIAELIQRSQVLCDRAKRISNDDSLSGMYALFLAPQLTGGLKLTVDMILMFLLYLGKNAVMSV